MRVTAQNPESASPEAKITKSVTPKAKISKSDYSYENSILFSVQTSEF